MRPGCAAGGAQLMGTFEYERRCVEGSGLVEAVVEVIEQRVVQAEAGAEAGLAVAEGVPGEADARVRVGSLRGCR